MAKMIGCCGLTCSACPAFLATQRNDDEERKRVAEMWSKEFNRKIEPEEINCDGCLSHGGRLMSHSEVCEIRLCCRGKGLNNCAHCGDYQCEKLKRFIAVLPEAQLTLEEIRGSI